MLKRPQATEIEISQTIEQVCDKLAFRLSEKGYGKFVNKFELLGVLQVEFYELTKAIHERNDQEVIEELIDIVVGALFGIVSLKKES